MAMKNSKIEEEDFSNNNDELIDTFSHKLDLNEKESIIFPSEKIREININKTFTTNLSITEELNKSAKSTKMDSTIDNKFELIPFKFEWKENISNTNKELEVMITGSFLNNWEQFIKMDKNPETDIYEYLAYLPKKKHYFKYIINNKWLCSDLYPTTQDDSNNTNNYIDLTNYNINSPEKNYIILENNELYINNEKIKKKRKKEKKINDGYEIKYPNIKDLNVKAPMVMLHYKNSFLIDNQSNQYKFGIKDEFKFENNNYLNENNSYKKIFIFPHEKLRHITPNINDIFNNKKYNRYSITERKKHKYLTLVYYKPKEVHFE